MTKTKLIVRRDETGKIKTVVENHLGKRITIAGVAKIHFISGVEPQVVVTFSCDDVDVDVEISECLADELAARS